jgi:4-amino-4-deoxy-L-arabinose transferase-like glycosyltransferase
VINRISTIGLRRVVSRPQTLLAIGVSAVFVLSIFHHTMNFWGTTWVKQLLILALIPVLSIILIFFAGPLWERAVNTSWKRWLLFLLPALVVVSFITWRVFESPLLWHTLEIAGKGNSGRTETQLLEIRNSYGGVVPFAEIQKLGDWVVKDKLLTATGSVTRPLLFSFRGPFRSPVKLRFLTSPAAGDIQIKLDGKSFDVSLSEETNGQRVIQINPTYRFDIPGSAIVLLVIAIDFLALLSLFTMLWLIQEIQQTTRPPLDTQDDFSRQTYWKWLAVLLAITLVLHLINYFSVPLQLGEDSSGYLDGAVHWAKFHNLEGASPVRGPGVPFVFLPAILLFGRNPWGIKLLLHLLAIASVGLAYHLGWQLTRKYWFAFLAGLLIAINPDIFFYSNSVMSEIPNVFFVLLFCTVLLNALETLSFRAMLATILVASFTVLIRTENIVLLLLAVVFLTFQVMRRKVIPGKDRFHEMTVYVKQISFALFLAALPILAWSAHNYLQHGFLGLSNYAPEVLYTGWVYEGEASHIPITDQSSPAVKIINEAYWSDPEIAKEPHIATGWTIYLHMIKHGYSSQEIFSLLRQAALDSITNDYGKTWQVIVVKLRDSFKPETSQWITFPLSGEKPHNNWINPTYFDEEKLVIAPLVLLQRQINRFLGWGYVRIYPIWAWFCVGAMLLCLYRKPVIPWLPIVLITLFRVGLPNIFGLSLWRFVVSGLPLLQILGLAVLCSLYAFGRLSFSAYKTKVAYPFET